MPRTEGLSPKLIFAVLAAVVTYLLMQTILELPPGAVIGLQVVAIAVAAYRAGPGSVVQPFVGTPSDDLLDARTERELRTERGMTLPEVMVVCFLGILCLIALVVLLERV